MPTKNYGRDKGTKNCTQRKWVNGCLPPYITSKLVCTVFPLTMPPPPLNTIENKKCQLWVVETHFRINDDRRVIYSKGAQLVQRTEETLRNQDYSRDGRDKEWVWAPPKPSSTSPASCLCLESSPPLEGFLQMRIWQKAAWNPSFEFPDTRIRGLSRVLIQTLPKNFGGFSVHNISIYEQFEGRSGSLIGHYWITWPPCPPAGVKFVTRETGRRMLAAKRSCFTGKHIILYNSGGNNDSVLFLLFFF